LLDIQDFTAFVAKRRCELFEKIFFSSTCTWNNAFRSLCVGNSWFKY